MADLPPIAEGCPAERALRLIAAALEAGGAQTPLLDARVLLLHVLGISHAALLAAPERGLCADQARRLREMARRRMAGEPVSRILGRREFFGREFLISPHVLDPRPDTETLVHAALRAAAGMEAPFIVDAGAGSGAIIVSLLAELPAARGLAIDISAAALAMTRRNAEKHAVAGRLSCLRGDWLAALADESCDIIVSNPPYIPSAEVRGLAVEVSRHDPHLALDGGADGLDACRVLARQAARALRRGGVLLVEVGAGQAEDALEIMKAAGLAPGGAQPAVVNDLAGIPRVVTLGKW